MTDQQTRKPFSFAPKKIAPKPHEAAAFPGPASGTREKWQSRVVIIRQVNGVWCELPGPPAFMFPRKTGFGSNLPADHYIRGSKEHLDRKREVGLS